MLSLHVVTPAQGRHYYKEENYYTEGQAIQNSEWTGAGAKELGLSGAVKSEDFERLLNGKHPTREQEILGRRGAGKGAPRAGIDLTFSAPKSVSLAALVGGDERIEIAHRQAVEAALKVVEERYSIARVSVKGQRREEAFGNLVVAKFHHDTSRAKDPQLHTHAVVLNAVKRRDGEWRGLRNEGFYANSKLIGLLYQNELAMGIKRLGYAVTRNSNGTFEIDGYKQEELRQFSKRRVQLTDDLGAKSQKEARHLVKVNRPKKGKEVSREDLRIGWLKEAREFNLKHPKARFIEEEVLDHGDLLYKAMAHAGERDVKFKQESLERFALENSLGKVQWNRFQTQISEAHGVDLLPTVDRQWTTRAALLTEEKIIQYLQKGKEIQKSLLEKVPDSFDQMGLTTGQKEALKMAFLTKDQFTAWQGVAGAGKTYALKQFGIEAEKKGVRVFGFAPSAEAAKVLESEAQIPSRTVASLLKGKSEERGGVWIVDEAGLLSARDCEQLMSKARDMGAKVIFVGDTRQLSSVEAGNPFKLMQQNGIETAFLSESRRQKTTILKKAAEALAKGEMADGLKELDRSIYEFKREDTRVRHVAHEYLGLSPKERSKTLILAGTNRERRLMSEEIRSGLKKEGVLGEGIKFQSLVPKDLTKEEIKAGTKIEVGDVLVFHGADQGFVRGDLQTVLRRQGDKLDLKAGIFELRGRESFTVYRNEEREFSVGDRVRWTRNGNGLRNGEELLVTKASKDGLILTTSKGKEVSVKDEVFLDHAYVSTVYGSQGKTAERVLVSTDHTFGRESMYVAITRAKTEVKIFTEDKARMVGRAEVSRVKVSARDLKVQKFNKN